jgi:hypothetical protein
MGGNNVGVDLRILLRAITHQEKRKRGIGGQDLLD